MATNTSRRGRAGPSQRESAADTTLAGYAMRGRECAYGNVRMIARALGSLYDEVLRPVDLRAGQLALLWAIVATEPVEMARLGAATLTDQTTLSRTVANLRRAGLVSVRRGADARTRAVSLTARGRARFAAAMPYWEDAQRRVAGLLSVRDVRMLARGVHRAARSDLPPAR